MKKTEMGIPHLFRCPISLDLLTDPVTLCTGQTYDRPSIEKWLAAGNLTCPVTMQKLHDSSFVPNHTLRHLIDRWLETRHQFNPGLETVDPDHSLVATLKSTLESQEVSMVSKLQALEKISVLCEESTSRCSLFLQLGFMPLLLELILGKVESELSLDHVEFLEQALACTLQLLANGGVKSLDILKEDSKQASLVNLFKQGTNSIKLSICQLVDTISSSSEMEDLCAVLGQNRNFLGQIILLLPENSKVSEAAVRAIWSLCSLQSNGWNLVREGAVDGLVAHISTLSAENERRERCFSPLAVSTIERLLQGNGPAKQAFLNNPNGVSSLVRMVFGASSHEGSESAVNSLMIICRDSSLAREEAIGAGVLTQLLFLLQSQCSGRTKTKARTLLKMLGSSI
ncbi:U-box domain-containing protein 25-like [Syzygium oleosum]|uniref:U-box domain-containing protein 25-like n=1 Tax=Syzygium oleosum TaxID=219896 RepID=UPI0011D29E85|nr:U-box domain-containing protein 25-like [Syzygium oleosum]